jgi:hypothetical protein
LLACALMWLITMGNNLFDEPEDGVLRVGADDYDVISAYNGLKLEDLMKGTRGTLTKTFKAIMCKSYLDKYGKTSIAIANASLESIRQDSLKNYGRGGHD